MPYFAETGSSRPLIAWLLSKNEQGKYFDSPKFIWREGETDPFYSENFMK